MRERLAVSESKAPALLRDLAAVEGIRGASFLSTCNRAEAVVSSESEEAGEVIAQMLADRASLDVSELAHHLYVLRNRDAIRHLFRVASGLDSMIVGEPQIGGQVRAAFQAAIEAGSIDSSLQRVYEQTLRVAKRVRTETGIGENAVSVPFAAVELARKIFGELNGLNVLLIGAGEIAELTAEHLSGYGVKRVFVANRSFDKAAQLAAHFGGEAVHFDSLRSRLADADIVIASTSAPHHLVDASDVELALAERRRRDLFLIDLAVPRNIDPAISSLEGAYLYNVDDLKEVADANLEKRLKKAEQAEAIIEQELDAFMRRLASHEAIPTIVELQSHFEEIRRTELEKALRRLGPMTPEQRETVEALSSAIVNKILHHPIVRIKETAADQREHAESMRELIRRLFGLR